MSCHFSCSTCSSSIYMYKCLTCPPTRTLIDSTCICKSGYFEAQTSACYPASQASLIDQFILPIADGLYYTNIALFWLYLIIIFCRVNSPKIRITINMGQVISLLLNYPYLLNQTSKQFIGSISALNYSYLFNLYTCTSSSICTFFEYIWEPMLILPAVLGCFFVSYFLINLCYKHALTQPITIRNYWSYNWAFVLFCFVDQTAVVMGYNLSKAAALSNWGYLVIGIYLIAVLLLLKKLFNTINTEKQSKILYRAQNSWAYGYDENYHLHFIDFLYTQARRQKIEPEALASTGKPAQQPSSKNAHKIQMFMPHSNMYIIQVLFKILAGATTVFLYEYKPTFIIICLIILLNIFMCWVGVFFFYDKSTISLYCILSIIAVICFGCYWMTFFWLIAMIVSFMVTGVIGAVMIVLFFANTKINDKLVNRMFRDDVEDMQIRDADQLSQQEMIVKNHQEEQLKHETDLLNSQPAQTTKKQPFIGNLTRKTRPKPNQTVGPVLSTEDQFKKQNSARVPKDRQNEQPIQKQESEISPPQQNPIRHSSYQTKLSNAKTKLSARNKTKNIFENLEEPNENRGKKQEKLRTQTLSRNQTKFHLNNNGGDEFLSNVLEEPAEDREEKD